MERNENRKRSFYILLHLVERMNDIRNGKWEKNEYEKVCTSSMWRGEGGGSIQEDVCGLDVQLSGSLAKPDANGGGRGEGWRVCLVGGDVGSG
jgi:hypothetical protein